MGQVGQNLKISQNGQKLVLERSIYVIIIKRGPTLDKWVHSLQNWENESKYVNMV